MARHDSMNDPLQLSLTSLTLQDPLSDPHDLPRLLHNRKRYELSDPFPRTALIPERIAEAVFHRLAVPGAKFLSRGRH